MGKGTGVGIGIGVVALGATMLTIAPPTILTDAPDWVRNAIAIVSVCTILAGASIILLFALKKKGIAGIAIAARLEDEQGSYGRSVDGQLSTATVFVEVTAENSGASAVRISALRCELYRRRFGFWTQLVETLPYFHSDPMDWLLVADGLPETRSVTFSRLHDSPWSFAKIQPGETLGARIVAEFSNGRSPVVRELPKLPVKGPYA